MNRTISKAVIPAAGFGTRMLPATKCIPKEMLPVDGRPVIQHIVEELVDAGITDILIIIRKGKEVIKDHFTRDITLEKRIQSNYPVIADGLRKLADLANFRFIYQDEMKGLGDAISYAENFVGAEPFCIALGDTLIKSQTETSSSQSLIDNYHILGKSIVAVEKVAPRFRDRYGMLVQSASIGQKLYQAKKWVEKPGIDQTDSNLAIASRYVFTAHIFDELRLISSGYNGEIQITDAMDRLTQSEGMYAFELSGTRYDIGNKEGFAKAILDYQKG